MEMLSSGLLWLVSGVAVFIAVGDSRFSDRLDVDGAVSWFEDGNKCALTSFSETDEISPFNRESSGYLKTACSRRTAPI